MIKINLLPKEARKRVGFVQQIVLMSLMLLVTFVGIGFYWSYLNGVIEQKNQEIANTQARLQELQKIIDEINKFEAQRVALEQKLAVIAKLEKEQKLPVRMLDEVYKTLEDDLWLTSFTQQGDALAINGSALSNPVVSDYMRNLQASKFFKDVELVVSQSRLVGTQTIRDFQLKMALVAPPDLTANQAAPQETAGQ
ncbi:fumbrial assembly [Candidatus Moduliflexus flocculans]|uniref:Fumbrial assembly n=1 Tax=Candidatus Moduliflexus flocculans TaxID=1499966 RepID=A0A0S6W3E7_9BACT|nr:fumbrial assembly [Candidatus Moduliflexus flocculans]